MPIVTEKYVRKPLYVDAIQVTEENFVEVAQWCQGEIRAVMDDLPVAIAGNDLGSIDPAKVYIHVRVQNPKSPRQTKAMVGDWLLYADTGGYKVYTQKAFGFSFDLVNANQLELAEDVEQPDDEAADVQSAQ